MRNDFPLFACLELGARHVRLPLTDLADPVQSERIALLRAEGVQITATWLWSERHDFASHVARHREHLDGLEVQVPGVVFPPEACLREIHRCAAELRVPVTLATVIAREIVAGKQHPRTRIGYRVTELAELDHYLGQRGARLDRVLCRADATAPPGESLRLTSDSFALRQIGAVDWVVDLVGRDELDQLNRVAEAVFASALSVDGRLFLDPLIDLDRTMDVTHALLDRQCNPRPSFHAARCLNSILFSSPEPRRLVASPELAGARIIGACGPKTTAWLLLPLRSGEPLRLDPRRLDGFQSDGRAAYRYDLANGTSQPLHLGSVAPVPPIVECGVPTLLVVERQRERHPQRAWRGR
jgi:hypothetical protein